LDLDATAFEDDDALGQGEQGVIPAPADEPARLEWCAALADDDRSDTSLLPAEQLHAPVLSIAVPTVSGRALSLLMSHW